MGQAPGIVICRPMSLQRMNLVLYIHSILAVSHRASVANLTRVCLAVRDVDKRVDLQTHQNRLSNVFHWRTYRLLQIIDQNRRGCPNGVHYEASAP